jgi:Spy/CpxP family protein refolding chaperone
MMKKILIVACFCFVGTSLLAQIRRTIAPKTDSLTAAPVMDNEGGIRKDNLKALNLDKQQKSKLKDLMQAAKQEKEAIENDGKLTEEQRKQKLQELRKRRMAQMDTILTPEQKQKMAKMRRDAIKEKRAGKNEASEMDMKLEQ